MSRRLAICLMASLCSLCLCGASWAADARAKVTYDEHVLPILRESCVACHNPDKARSGLVLNNYTKVMEGGSSGAVVKPGDPDGSRLFQLVAHKQEPYMPPKATIPPANIDTIRRWIEGGALENAGSTAKIVDRKSTRLNSSH